MDRNLLPKLLKIGLVLNLMVLNGMVGYGLYVWKTRPTPQVSTETVPTIQYVGKCGTECQAYITAQLKTGSPKPTSTPTPTPTAKPVVVTAPKTKVRTTSYLPISVAGSSANFTWTDLPGTEFYFDVANYPGLVAIYFEANIRLLNGNGTAYVQLYDTNHGIGVQGSGVQTSNQASTAVESGQVSFWSGKNLIRVQAKTLTADTAIFDSGRLRIITEN